MRSRLYLITAVLTSLTVGAVAAISAALAGLGGEPPDRPGGWSGSAPAPPASAPAAPGPPAAPEPVPAEPGIDLTADVTVEVDGFFSWAALDRRTGERAGSGNQHHTTTTESMIKVWVVADFLRRLDGEEPSDRELDDARRAIRDSHNGATERLYAAGGGDDVVERMIDMCGLADSEVHPGWWSRTEISARDAVRIGECVADGTAAGPEWTEWVLAEMTRVRGTTDPSDQPMDGGGEGGRWGIIDGLPDQIREDEVAIKNGWTAVGRTNSWHVNCLAITDDWVIAVLLRYPAEESLEYGARRCAEVAEQLLPARRPAAADIAAEPA